MQISIRDSQGYVLEMQSHIKTLEVIGSFKSLVINQYSGSYIGEGCYILYVVPEMHVVQVGVHGESPLEMYMTYMSK